MTLFNLPSNILSNIYAMDSTYREIFKTQICPEIINKSYDIFRRNFINNPWFENEPKIISRKINVLLEYLFKYENRSIINGMIANEISINTNLKGMDYCNNIITLDDTGYNDTNNTGLYVGIYSNNPIYHFEVYGYYIFTTNQYNELKNTMNLEKIIFKNDEFVVCQSYEEQYYDEGEEEFEGDDYYWGNTGNDASYDDDDF